MKKILILLTLLIGVAAAAPISTFSWTAPTQYVDGNMIPATDILSYRLYCGDTQGGPYPYMYEVGSGVVSAVEDLATCVQGVPGTYYFVATATSTDFGSESDYSNEVFRNYTATDLGRVPLPPSLLSVQ